MTSAEGADPRWVRLATAAELQAAGRMEALAGRRAVLLLWREEGPAACAAHCPHAMAPLVDGAIRDGRLHCARHLASFDLLTGEPDATWRIPPLDIYPARTRDGWVEVRLNA